MGTDYTGTAFFLLVIGSLLAWPLSILLLKSYKKRVLRSMNSHPSARSRPLDVPTAPFVASDDSEGIQTSIITPTSAARAGGIGEALYLQAIREPRRSAVLYSVAGLLFSAIMAAANAMSGGRVVFMQWLVLLCIFAWPIVICINLVMVSTLRVKITSVAAYFLVLLAVFSIAAARSPGVGVATLLGSWAIQSVPPTLLFLAFLNRRIRAVGPMVLTFTLVTLVGAIVGISVLDVASAATDSAAARGFFAIAASLGLNACAMFALFILMGLALFGALGWLANGWIANLYVAKRVNDHSLTIDAVWLLFGSMQSIGLAFAHPAWILASLAAFAAYKTAIFVGFRVVESSATVPDSKVNLLFLRVFSLGRRSERVFDAIAKNWRYVGNVQLIAGADLATTIIEPHEFLNYLSRKIDHDFISDEQSLHRKLEDLDVTRDFDRRYRVNDFFCYENTWRTVLSRLVEGSDAVFMDARGFSSENAGVAFELNELVNAVPLQKIVLAVDRGTDHAFLQQVLNDAWSRVRSDSPNLSSSNALRLFQLDTPGPDEVKQVMRCLFEACLQT